MKTFILHWRDGSTNEIRGESIADAINKYGWGQGALRALDYWEEKKEDVAVQHLNSYAKTGKTDSGLPLELNPWVLDFQRRAAEALRMAQEPSVRRDGYQPSAVSSWTHWEKP